MRIGIFDSGIGGEAIANTIRTMLPQAEVISVNDHKNVPYGNREPQDIINLTNLAIQPLISADCDVIVIACNTATTVAITSLRLAYPDQKFIGIEPMIKPASQMTRTGNIAVCATIRTLESARYQELKNTWAKHINVIEPDCSKWAGIIEQGESDKIDIQSLISNLSSKNADVIVLGCTHFHWLKQKMTDEAPGIKILEPSDSIVERIKSLIGPIAH
jgi:glutamate racemase